MDIVFKNTKFEELMNSFPKLKKAYGNTNASLIRRRLDDLRAAKVLEELRYSAGKCHQLTGNRKGQLAVNVEQPYRMIFEPCHNPVPKKNDGGLYWSSITCIRIIEFLNYHG
jgi:proteic killer suppression protein